jgi:hypothetical protein
MNEEKFLSLLSQHCNDTISDDDFEVLETVMLSKPELRSIYLSYMNMDAALQEQASEFVIDETPQKSNRPLLLSLISFAAVITVLLSINLSVMIKGPTQIAQAVPLQSGVATITKAINVKGNETLQEGITLDAGILEFDEGLVQIEFFSGAMVIAEGPLKIDVIDHMNIICEYGKLRSHVPNQAKGFKISAPTIDVVDLGTEFSFNLEKGSQTPEIFVYDGEVELLHKNGVLLKSLVTNEGASYNQNTLSSIAKPEGIINFQNMQELDAQANQSELEQWHLYAEKMRTREDVILFYSFEKENNWSRTLKNENKTHGSAVNGAIVGCRWSNGRWPGKGALDFKSTGDRIRVNIPGSYEAITLSCWVRVEGFDRWLSSLLLTDNFDLGELHWQLSDVGEIILGSSGSGNTFSPQVISPIDLGRWLHLSTSYDSKARLVKHYMNGKLVSTKTLQKSIPASFGVSEIGNWSCRPGTDNAIRSLNGKLDEFTIFSRSLSEKEIQALYKQGNP